VSSFILILSNHCRQFPPGSVGD